MSHGTNVKRLMPNSLPRNSNVPWKYGNSHISNDPESFHGIDSGNGGLVDKGSSSGEYGFYLADRHIDDILSLQVQRYLLPFGELPIVDRIFDICSVGVAPDDPDRLHRGLKGCAVGERESLGDIELSILLHEVTAGAKYGSKDIDNAGTRHNHRIAIMEHHLRNRRPIAIPAVGISIDCQVAVEQVANRS